jgi:serine/threonine-protein kinase HipA
VKVDRLSVTGPTYLSTAIDYETTAARIDALMGVAEHFRLSGDEARAALRDVSGATSRWRAAAQEVGLDRTALEQMAPAFEHEQAVVARAMGAWRAGA